MKGSVRKRGTTWSYRIDFGKVDGKRHQIEKGGYKTKKHADKALNDALYQINNTGDYVENKKISEQKFGYCNLWYAIRGSNPGHPD